VNTTDDPQLSAQDEAVLRQFLAGQAKIMLDRIEAHLYYRPSPVPPDMPPETSGELLGEIEKLLADKVVYYRPSEYTPKTDAKTGEPVFYHFAKFGYFILHPDNLPLFKSLAYQTGYRAEELSRDQSAAPGYAVPTWEENL
jgi:hypothetical protein